MTTRRKFLQISATGAALLATNKSKAAEVLAGAAPASKPLVISTWTLGQPANTAAWAILSKGGKALDAVEAGVKVPEADPTERSVGLGGRPDRDGRVTLDACIMDEKMNIGAVACLEHIVHPISVARAVMEKTPHVMLTGDGALKFAIEQGFKKQNLLTPESEAEWKEWLKESKYKPLVNIENHDTIGMLAIDSMGNLSGACTTSGMAFKMRGRVGDSPIIGAGLYVDNEVGAATATGHGEEVIRVAGSHAVVEMMRQGHPPETACRLVVERILKSMKLRGKNTDDTQVGFIAINKKGEHGAFCLQKGFNYAAYSNNENNVLIDAKSLL